MYECRLNALLDGKSTDASWIPGWLLYLHWTEHQNFYLLTLISPLGINDNQESDRLRSQLGQIKSSCSFLNDRNLILILNAKDKEALQKCVSQLSEILPQHNLKAGLSERFDNILDLPEYRQQALDALKASAILGDSALISNYQEKMVYDLLLKASNPQRCYGDYRLQVLEDYDKKNGTDYCHTLHVFMKNAFNKNQTASILFIHRNSLSYRLHKIKEILDLDLSDGEDCQKLYLAFKSRELEAALGKRLK
jgi:sugar diacid utilization regulator